MHMLILFNVRHVFSNNRQIKLEEQSQINEQTLAWRQTHETDDIQELSCFLNKQHFCTNSLFFSLTQ